MTRVDVTGVHSTEAHSTGIHSTETHSPEVDVTEVDVTGVHSTGVHSTGVDVTDAMAILLQVGHQRPTEQHQPTLVATVRPLLEPRAVRVGSVMRQSCQSSLTTIQRMFCNVLNDAVGHEVPHGRARADS